MAITPGGNNELEVQITGDGSDLSSTIAAAKTNIDGLMKKVGALSGALGALGVAGFGKAVQEAAEFESAMVELEKVTNPETAEEMTGAIKDMATTLPVAQKELAGVAADAARFGVRGPENIRNFTESVSKMAVATDLSTDQAGEAFAKLATITKTPISEVENLGSSINHLSNTMATSSSEIVSNMQESAATLSSMGATQTEIAGLGAAMNEVFNSASKAGRGLRRIGQEMMEGRDKAGGFADALGVSWEQFERMRQTNPAQTIIQLAEAMSEGGDKAKLLRAATTSFSQKALTGLAQNTDAARKAMQEANVAFEKNTSLQEEFDAASDTFENQLQLVQNRLTGVAITLGEKLLPVLTTLLKRIQPLIGRLEEFASGLSETQVQAAAVQSVVMAVTGALATFVPQLRVAALAVQALSAVFLTHRQKITSAVLPVYQAVRDELASIQTAAKELSREVRVAFAPLFGAFRSLEISATNATNGILGSIQGRLISGIKNAGSVISSTLRSMTVWFITNSDRIQGTLMSLHRRINSLSTQVDDKWRSMTQGIEESTRRMRTQVLGGFKAFGDSLVSRIRGDTSEAERTFAIGMSQMRLSASNGVQKIGDAFAELKTRLPQPVQSALSTVSSKTRVGLSTFKNDIVAPALAGVERLWDNHADDVKREVNDVMSHVRTKPDETLTLLASVIVPGPLSTIYKAFKDNFGLIKNETSLTFAELRKTVRVGMTAMQNQIVGPLQNSESQFRQTFREIGVETRESLSMVRDIVTRITKTIVGRFGPFARRMMRIWQRAMGGPDGILANGREAFTALWGNVIKPILDLIQAGWRQHGDDIIKIFDATLGTLLTVAEIGFDTILSAFNSFLMLMHGDVDGALTNIKNLWKRNFTRIGVWLKTDALNLISGAVGLIIDAITRPFEWLYNYLIGNSLIPKMLSEMHARFILFFKNTKRRLGAFIGNAVNKFTNFGTTLNNTANRKLKTLHDRFAQTFRNVRNRMFAWAGTLQNRFRNMGTFLLNTANRNLKALHDRFAQMFSTVRSRFFAWTSTLRRRLGGALTRMRKMAGRWVSHFTRPFRNAKDRVLSEFSELKRRVVGNSIVPDMLSETVRESDRWVRPFTRPFRDAKSKAIREFNELKQKLGRKAKEIREAAKVKSIDEIVSEHGEFGSDAAQKIVSNLWAPQSGNLRALARDAVSNKRYMYAKSRTDSGWKKHYKRNPLYGQYDKAIQGLKNIGRGNWGANVTQQMYDYLATRGSDLTDELYSNLPQLSSGGFVKEAGLAMLHANEQVVPAADVDRNRSGGTTINIGSIEASGRREGREAAKAIRSELRSGNF